MHGQEVPGRLPGPVLSKKGKTNGIYGALSCILSTTSFVDYTPFSDHHLPPESSVDRVHANRVL